MKGEKDGKGNDGKGNGEGEGGVFKKGVGGNGGGGKGRERILERERVLNPYSNDYLVFPSPFHQTFTFSPLFFFLFFPSLFFQHPLQP